MKKLHAAFFVLALLLTLPATTYARPPASLHDGLISYWPLHEASGTRADVAGPNDLSDPTGTGNDTGVIGYAAYFDSGANDHLSAASPTGLDACDCALTVAGWVYHFGSSTPVVEKENSYRVFYNAVSGKLEFSAETPSGTRTVSDTVAGAGNWIFFVAWHDPGADTLNIQINNGTIQSLAHSTGVDGGVSAFHLGTGTGDSAYLALDEVGFWSTVLTTTDRTNLYNGGAGCGYPFTACEPATPTPSPTVTPTATPSPQYYLSNESDWTFVYHNFTQVRAAAFSLPVAIDDCYANARGDWFLGFFGFGSPFLSVDLGQPYYIADIEFLQFQNDSPVAFWDVEAGTPDFVWDYLGAATMVECGYQGLQDPNPLHNIQHLSITENLFDASHDGRLYSFRILGYPEAAPTPTPTPSATPNPCPTDTTRESKNLPSGKCVVITKKFGMDDLTSAFGVIGLTAMLSVMLVFSSAQRWLR